MEKEAIRNYLELLRVAVADRVKGSVIEESDAGLVLLCSVDSPFIEGGEAGYSISVEPVDDGLLSLEVIIFLFNDISSENAAGLNTLINTINAYVLFGSFRFFDDSGAVMLVQGTLIDKEQDISSVTDMLAKTISILDNTALNAGEYIFRYLNGEALDEILDEIERED